MMLGFSEGEIAMAAMIIGGICFLVWVLSHQWRKAREAAYNARLKQLMIERGMTAGEIERILASPLTLDNDQAREFCGSDRCAK